MHNLFDKLKLQIFWFSRKHTACFSIYFSSCSIKIRRKKKKVVVRFRLTNKLYCVNFFIIEIIYTVDIVFSIFILNKELERLTTAIKKWAIENKCEINSAKTKIVEIRKKT